MDPHVLSSNTHLIRRSVLRAELGLNTAGSVEGLKTADSVEGLKTAIGRLKPAPAAHVASLGVERSDASAALELQADSPAPESAMDIEARRAQLEANKAVFEEEKRLRHELESRLTRLKSQREELTKKQAVQTTLNEERGGLPVLQQAPPPSSSDGTLHVAWRSSSRTTSRESPLHV